MAFRKINFLSQNFTDPGTLRKDFEDLENLVIDEFSKAFFLNFKFRIERFE